MQQIYGAKVSVLTWGGLAGTLAESKKPIQQCMAELPEVSRGHSTRNGKDQTIGGFLKFEVHEERQ